MATNSFEVKFGILADAQVNEKVPAVKKNMLGFQVVANDPDENKAVGIIAYKIGSRLVYVPVFWLNGRVKGGDFMYLKQEDRCLPFNEIFVNFIETGKNFSLGDPDGANNDQTGGPYRVSTMDMTWLHSKRAGELSLIDPEDVLKMAAPSNSTAQIDLKEHLKVFSPKAAADLADAITREPKLANALFTYYSPQELYDIVGSRLTDTPVKKASDPLVVYTNKYSKEASDLTLEEKQELVRDGIYIRDNRKEASEIYTVRKANNKYTTPQHSGKFNVLNSSYDIVERYIFLVDNEDPYEMSTHGTRYMGRDRNQAIIIDTDNKTYCMTEPTNIMVETPRGDLKIKDVAEDVIGENVSKESIRAIVTSKEDASGNVPSWKKDIPVTELSRRVIFYNSTDGAAVMGIISVSGSGDVVFKDEANPMDSEVKVILTDRPGKLFIKAKSALYLPNTARIIDLDKYTRDWKGTMGYVVPDSLNTTTFPQELGLETVKVASDGISYTINSSKADIHGVSYNKALLNLVENHGLRVKQAKELLSDVKDKGKSFNRYEEINCFIKYAYDNEEEEGFGDDHFLTKEIFTSPGLSSSAVDDIYKASQKGVKEVLDTKVLSELAKSAYPIDKTADYLPTFMSCLDKLSRILFLFYWHNDQFAERYGKQNMDSIEDSIKDNIQSLGDLVMYLKEKTVSADEALANSNQGDDLTKDMF